MTIPPTILFAGGGTGGHIYPNMAIFEALKQRRPECQALFLVSQRNIDQDILKAAHLPFIQLPAQPLRANISGIIQFAKGFIAAQRQTKNILRKNPGAVAMVATGGFVSAPAMSAASKKNLPTALVNLDAVPGKANKRIARYAQKQFSVYETPALPQAEIIEMPLRQKAQVTLDNAQAKAALGFDPGRQVLLITAGSQGASSINKMMTALCQSSKTAAILSTWQVYHVCGNLPQTELNSIETAYRNAGISCKVEPFCQNMGLAWAAADLAISRAGASSVAEIRAAGLPAIFLPYPYHKDQHQRKNAQPLVDAGGAVVLTDLIDPDKNVAQIEKQLTDLMTDSSAREQMREALDKSRVASGNETVVNWLYETASFHKPD